MTISLLIIFLVIVLQLFLQIYEWVGQARQEEKPKKLPRAPILAACILAALGMAAALVESRLDDAKDLETKRGYVEAAGGRFDKNSQEDGLRVSFLSPVSNGELALLTLKNASLPVTYEAIDDRTAQFLCDDPEVVRVAASINSSAAFRMVALNNHIKTLDLGDLAGVTLQDWEQFRDTSKVETLFLESAVGAEELKCIARSKVARLTLRSDNRSFGNLSWEASLASSANLTQLSIDSANCDLPTIAQYPSLRTLIVKQADNLDFITKLASSKTISEILVFELNCHELRLLPDLRPQNLKAIHITFCTRSVFGSINGLENLLSIVEDIRKKGLLSEDSHDDIREQIESLKGNP